MIDKKAAHLWELEKALKSAEEEEKKGLWSITYDLMNKLCIHRFKFYECMN